MSSPSGGSCFTSTIYWKKIYFSYDDEKLRRPRPRPTQGYKGDDDDEDD